MLTLDTSMQAERLQVERWRKMSPAEKLDLVTELSKAVEELSLAGIRRSHPEDTEEECRLRLAVLKLGRDLACKVYPEAALLKSA